MTTELTIDIVAAMPVQLEALVKDGATSVCARPTAAQFQIPLAPITMVSYRPGPPT